MLKKVAIGAIGGLAVTTTAAYHFNESVRRPLIIWKDLGPVIMHYRMIELKQKIFPLNDEEADAEYHQLHKKYAQPVMETLRDLRGFYVKVGQVLASRNDMLPDLYTERLRKLEDQVPHSLTSDEAKETVRTSLGLQNLEDVFTEFHDKPLGSASIGQVHKAKLKNGDWVAVKVQDPDSERLFLMDIANSKYFCKIFAPEQVILFEEIEKQFKTEFAEIERNMRQFTNVVVPKPYLELTTKNVLTMQFLTGPKLIDGIREKGRQYAKSIGKSFEDFEKEMRKDIDKNGMPPPYNGPSAFTLSVYQNLLRTKDFIINLPILAVNSVVGIFNLMTFNSIPLSKVKYYESFIPLNSSFIMDTILKVHGHQLLHNGVFNADCHPGNFLLLNNGKIGLIDYGQVKRLTKEERKTIAQLVVAVSEDNEDEIYRINLANGYKSKHLDKYVMRKMLTVGLDQDGRHVTEGMNLQQFMDKMFARDPWEESPPFMIMPIRLSLLLRGVGLAMGHPVSVCTAWKPIALQALKEMQ